MYQTDEQNCSWIAIILINLGFETSKNHRGWFSRLAIRTFIVYWLHVVPLKRRKKKMGEFPWIVFRVLKLYPVSSQYKTQQQ